ncbi:MAG: right-handed parallel beta-helix repeat-containing protein, partial [Verrucomicrobiales bacterium]|nr:right-handed parallel beta-helix repeat-containing protein [Verrucomicrobiales bacterium]
WVSTGGNDANPGTSNAPFATPQKAVTLSALAPGDTIYVRGGTYALNTPVKPSKSGTATNYIRLWAYPGELPVFDFATMPASAGKALDVRRDYWHVRGIEVKNAPDNGIFVGGMGNIIEGCVVHDCGNDGIALGSTSVRATNTLILNCDSYRNYGGGDGNNGDGFAAKAGCGPGNVFRGCRAWHNADDGWDFYYNTNHSVVLEGCWAFWNGYNLWGYTGTWNGNGNGFKLGGAGTQARHFLTNCVTFGNRRKGFDHNHSSGGQTIVHSIGYSNGTVNFSLYETPTVGTNLLINNASYLATATSLDPTTIQISNSWQGISVGATDFASLDVSLALAPRNADYSLPSNALFRLVAGSRLIDRGTAIPGRSFSGSAPDLGPFEYIPPPTGPLTLTAPSWSNGVFRFRLEGLSGRGPVVIYSSSNLAGWTPFYTNPPATGALQLLDASAVGPARFYRAEER